MSNDHLFDLSGKVALVTGAGGGLGAEFAGVMAEAGADVVCADIDLEGAEATAAGQQDRPGRPGRPLRRVTARRGDLHGRRRGPAIRAPGRAVQ